METSGSPFNPAARSFYPSVRWKTPSKQSPRGTSTGPRRITTEAHKRKKNKRVVSIVAVEASLRRGFRTGPHVGRRFLRGQPARPERVRELIQVFLPLRVLAQDTDQHLERIAAAPQRVQAEPIAFDERRAAVAPPGFAVLQQARSV